jgi:uncharacterized caspase-like protein
MTDELLRAVGSRNREKPVPVRRGRNVIAVIGIDDYVHWRRLNNAVSDAQGVRNLFVNDLGFQELVPPLFNAEATRESIFSNLLDPLRSELKTDDSLVFFFAGHGHTETTSVGERKINTGYLIPVAGLLPEERRFGGFLKLDSFLEDLALLPARHIMVILDACYSGFALGDAVKVLRDHEPYTDDLDRRVSRNVITSAMHDQPALDNGPIPGHSLFTGVLIEALQSGRADRDNRGFVTGSELALHVQKEVLEYAQASSTRQTPDYGYFELHQRGELVIALRGETHNKNQAQTSLEAARHGEALGRFTGDRKRFVFAASQYQEAVRFAGLAKMAFPEAELGLGRALLAAGDAPGALETLGELVEVGADTCPPDALFYLGMAHAVQKAYDQAAGCLSGWLEKNAADENAAWVEEYIRWLQGASERPSARRLALVVGVDEYQSDDYAGLRGCANDAEKLMAPALVRCSGFPEGGHHVRLTNQQATLTALTTALEKLRDTASPQDSVVVHFSGHSTPPEEFASAEEFAVGSFSPANLPDLARHAKAGRGCRRRLDGSRLHHWMQSIPAGHKTLILDTHASLELIELARSEGTYALMVASDTAELAYEWHTEVDGEEIPCGMLTAALFQSLEQNSQKDDFTYADWFIPAVEFANQASQDYPRPQTPYFVGLLERRPFGGDDPYLAAFEFVQRGCWPERTVEQLANHYRLFRRPAASAFPQAHLAFGRAFLARRAYPAAVEALQKAHRTITARLSRRLPLPWLKLR